MNSENQNPTIQVDSQNWVNDPDESLVLELKNIRDSADFKESNIDLCRKIKNKIIHFLKLVCS